MSYWAALGLPGEALTGSIEALAQWIQWAMYALGQGISENSNVRPSFLWRLIDPGGSLTGYTNAEVARYNLSQFWAAKDQVLAQCSTEDQRRQVYRLDMLAHGCLNALDSGLMYASAPNYWDYWHNYLTGGNASTGAEALAVEARQAAKDAARAASQAGLGTMATYFNQAAENVSTDLANANAFWNQPGVLNVAGISWEVWALAGLTALLVLR